MKNMYIALATVLFGTSLAFPAEPVSKQEAETKALDAVGGGEVLSATLDTKGLSKDWIVNVDGSRSEYEVKVDATSGKVLKVTSQPLASSGTISKSKAEQDALAAVGGGEVLQIALDTIGTHDRKVWSVDILGSMHEFEVLVDEHTGAIVKIITQPLETMASATALTPCKFLTMAKAEKIALAAVGANKVIAAVLDKTDAPVNWSVDVVTSRGAEYEVKVNACTGKVIAIIIGG